MAENVTLTITDVDRRESLARLPPPCRESVAQPLRANVNAVGQIATADADSRPVLRAAG